MKYLSDRIAERKGFEPIIGLDPTGRFISTVHCWNNRGWLTRRIRGASSRIQRIATKINLVVPLTVYLVVNIPPWFGFSYLYVVFRWATFQNTLTLGGNYVFPITYVSAFLLLTIAAYRFRKRIGLSYTDSLILGAGLATAGTGLFELIWQGLGTLYYPSQITGGRWIANYVLNGSWIFLAFGSFRYWRASRRFLTMTFSFVLGWVIWLALGFPQVFPSASPVALVMNSSLKILSFLLFFSLVNFEKQNQGKELKSPVDSRVNYQNINNAGIHFSDPFVGGPHRIRT